MFSVRLALATLLMVLLGSSHAHAACSWNGNTGTVASPYDLTDVAACVSDASKKTGDIIIRIPACTVSWDSNLSIDMSTGFAGVTSLTLQGSGTLPNSCASATAAGLTIPTSCGSSGETSITMAGSGIMVTGAAGKKWRISNLSLSGSAATNRAMIQPTGTSKPSDGGGFRIDHITFRNCTSTLIKSSYAGTTAGVIDHIDAISAIQFSNWAHLVSGGNLLWSSDLVPRDMIYIEDSYAENSAMPVAKMFADISYGASVVVRNNGIKNYYLGGHDASSDARSGRWYEAYGNQFLTTGSYGSDFMGLRGGSGVIFNNTGKTSNSNPFQGNHTGIIFTNYRSENSDSVYCIPETSRGGWPAIWATTTCNSKTSAKMCIGSIWSSNLCASDADCGGAVGSCAQIDANTDGSGWPCRDQIGVGVNQNKTPLLVWNNTLSIQGGEDLSIIPYVSPCASDHIKANRDYCYDKTTMPVSCNGVDTTYAPYSYPHPLSKEFLPIIDGLRLEPQG